VIEYYQPGELLVQLSNLDAVSDNSALIKCVYSVS
jgi:hypothetical protein